MIYDARTIFKSMLRQYIINALLFLLFFSIGAVSLGISVLCEDLVQYYQNKQLLHNARESLEQAKLLTNEYDILLSKLENDPNLVKRIARSTLGGEPEDPNVVYPKAKAELLAAARKALSTDSNNPSEANSTSVIPNWLQRSSKSRNRLALFISGIFLIMIALVCFRPSENKH